MKNPLNKRLPRELKGDIGKYIVIFIFLVATIGVVSGFLVAGTSMKTAFDESFDKNNIEDGNFVLESKMTDDLKTKLEDEDLTLYDNFYKEETYKSSTYRIYKMRNDVDKIELFDGEFPTADNEIALDRLFSENNDIKSEKVLENKGNFFRHFFICDTIAIMLFKCYKYAKYST